MSLAARVIPVMLCRGTSLVKGSRFVNDRVVGHVLQAAKVHAARGVDELMILDVTATAEGRGPDLAMIEELTDGCFIPVTVGGGIRSLEQITALLRAGADKVCMGWHHHDLNFLRSVSDHFGSQAIVVSIDHKEAEGRIADIEFTVSIAESMAEDACVGEILLNNIDRDGTLQGYDLDLIRQVAAAVPVPVIACGGCSGEDDMVEAVRAGASACAAGALFQFTDVVPLDCSNALKRAGLTARCGE